MTHIAIASFAGLTLAQIIFYKIRFTQAVKWCWVLAGIYLFIFLILRIGFAMPVPASFVPAFPLLLFALLFALNGFLQRSGNVKTENDFYLYSGIWAGVIQISFLGNGTILNGFLESLLAAFFLPLFAAINERLELLDIPEKLAGLPVLLIAGGLLLLGLFGFLQTVF